MTFFPFLLYLFLQLIYLPFLGIRRLFTCARAQRRRIKLADCQTALSIMLDVTCIFAPLIGNGDFAGFFIVVSYRYGVPASGAARISGMRISPVGLVAGIDRNDGRKLAVLLHVGQLLLHVCFRVDVMRMVIRKILIR